MDTFELNGVRITWLGHASFRIEGGPVIYIDPYVLDQNPKPADLILMTHDHFDHCPCEILGKIEKGDTEYVSVGACLEKCGKKGIVVRPGDEVEVKGVKIKAVPAYNVGKPFHPREKGYVGYIVTVQGVRIYHAGDTDLIPEMEGLDVDVALLPIGGTYTMDEREAAEAVKRMEVKYVIPMHYNYLQGLEKDPLEFARLVEGAEVVILEPRVKG